MKHTTLALFILSSLFVKAVILKLITKELTDILDWCIKKLLHRSPQELALWNHYDARHRGTGHDYPNPLRCLDGSCRDIRLV